MSSPCPAMEADADTSDLTTEAAVDALKSSAREVVDKASAEQNDSDPSNDESHQVNGVGDENGADSKPTNTVNGTGTGNGSSDDHEEEEEEERIPNGQHLLESSETQNGSSNSDMKEEEEEKVAVSEVKEENKIEEKDAVEDESKMEMDCLETENVKDEKESRLPPDDEKSANSPSIEKEGTVNDSDKAPGADGSQETEKKVETEENEETEDAEENSTTTPSASPRKKKKAAVEEVSLDDDSPPLRRSSRKKTPTKYAELIEKEIIRYEDDDLMEVQEIDDDDDDDDSDIQEVEPEDPLGSKSPPNTSTPSISITKATVPTSSLLANRKPNVVTIDDLKTLQRLATSAKKSVDDQKSNSFTLLDTQSILAGKMGSGVSITPARPRVGATIITPAGLNISPAGLTLGSGVTIKPNNSSVGAVITTPKTAQLGSVTITSTGSPSAAAVATAAAAKYAASNELSDPNLTDDTFVVEAPSFIVPYVYEKPPKETIKAFTESVTKLQKEKEEKEEKEREKQKKEKEEEQKKRREERQKRRDAGENDVEEDTDDEKEKKEEEEEKEKKKVEKENKEPEKKEEKKEADQASKDTYFNSTLGKFFSDLGMNLVQEFVQKDLLRQQQRRSQKDKSAAVIHAINSLQKNLDDSREQNELFHHQLKKCRFCSFRTESRVVLQNHLETPHMRNGVYRCNFCEYETKIPQEVLFHMDSVHGVKGRMERAPYFHQCPQCPFEDNGKGKLTRHKMGCDKRFKAEINQAPEREWDPPAKIRPTPVRPGYAAYMPTGAAAGTINALAMGRGGVATYGMGSAGTVIRPGQSLLPGNRNFVNSPRLQGAAGANRAALAAAAAARGRPVGSYKGPSDLRIPQPGLIQQQQAAAAKLRGLNPQMMSGQQMLALLNQQGLSVSQGQKGIRGTSPSISITPLPGKAAGSPLGAKGGMGAARSPQAGPVAKPGQPGAGQGKGNFVICEICDGYIKDLEQLRNHMQWIHKVKIHPKMIYNRPPLNCQKCQFRFFTDQGLERHLLGTHGLVTASMQDAANKGQDSGRCPVCGKVYQWKLLNHVAKDHGKTLKPAHLSYKCTVCTATFGQYKLFENHVYTAHSGVAKKADKAKQQAAKQGSVLKAPIKLSNEISIVSRKKADGSKAGDSEVIDLDDEEEIDDVEKEDKTKEVSNLKTPKKADEAATGSDEAGESSKRSLEEGEASQSKKMKEDEKAECDD